MGLSNRWTILNFVLLSGLASMSGMHYDYTKRNYLLPHGCKDLIDVLKLEEKTADLPPIFSAQMLPELFHAWKLPKITTKSDDSTVSVKPSKVTISDKISIVELALISGQQPFTIIADLLQLGDFVSMKDEVDFETAARLLKKYGFLARRPS
jgi:hypothetical protein